MIIGEGEGMEELHESGQKVQSSSYKISKVLGMSRIQHGDGYTGYTGKLLRVILGFPGGLVVGNPPANAGNMGVNPELSPHAVG